MQIDKKHSRRLRLRDKNTIVDDLLLYEERDEEKVRPIYFINVRQQLFDSYV